MKGVKVYFHKRWCSEAGDHVVIKSLLATAEKIENLSAEIMGEGRDVDVSRIVDGWYGDEIFQNLVLQLEKTEFGFRYNLRARGADVPHLMTSGYPDDPLKAHAEARRIAKMQTA